MTSPQPYAELTHAERCELLAVASDIEFEQRSHLLEFHREWEWTWTYPVAGVHNGYWLSFDPYNNPADHWALRGRMDEQEIHVATGIREQGDCGVRVWNGAGSVQATSDYLNFTAEVAAICEAYGRLRGLWV